ncbi:MAG: M60 family metallopeptidase [Planctomycetota bacterium]
MSARICSCILLLTAGLVIGSASADDADLRVLLNGVSEIAAPGVPGPLCVFGDQAFPVAVGRSGQEVNEPVVAAARVEHGRVVAFGHDGYLGSEALTKADTGRLVVNSVLWAAGQRGDRKDALRVGVHKHPALAALLSVHGAKVERLNGERWTRNLSEFDVICCSTHVLSETDIGRVKRYVHDGGGMITAGLGWGWLQLNPDRELDEHPGNKLLTTSGIIWNDGYLKKTTEVGYAVSAVPNELCQASRAVAALVAGKLPEADATQALWTAVQTARCLPADDTLLRPQLRKLQRGRRQQIVPTVEKPVTMKTPLKRLALTLQLDEAMKLSPRRVRAHRAADSFPGSVPTGARKVSRTINVDTSVPGWHGTGLYAIPGRPITIKVPSRVFKQDQDAAEPRDPLHVRIGAHQDKLWSQDKWTRCPEISRRFDLDQPSTLAANAFGGLIYIEVPPACDLDVIPVDIRGVVEAPLFVLDQTKLEDWRDEIRARPGPWAELASDKIIVTVPSESIRDLDDPATLLRLWDEIADACAELAAQPLERTRPERIVADRQISAGYMHAGYPIMTHLDAVEVMTDVKRLREGTWGLFHELGHNHQSPDWTFAGAGEVTVNLFTLYVFESVCGKYEESRPELFGDARQKMLRAYFDGGADFEVWKSKPFLALLMYMQIKEEFGWDVYRRVFAEYRQLPADKRPQSDDEKRDQWMIRMSQTIGRNLGPFFEAWGVPTSKAAREQVADLPAWMPKDFPPK